MTRARACWFHKDTGVGAWGVVPLVAGEYGKSVADNVEVGLRYSTPAFTAGAIVSPANGVLNQIWMVRGRSERIALPNTWTCISRIDLTCMQPESSCTADIMVRTALPLCAS